MNMKGLAEALGATGPAMNSILASSGTAGAAVGILHHGEIIHTAGYGFRDIGRQLPMDQNSVVPLFSLTKFMTAAALGSLLDANGASDFSHLYLDKNETLNAASALPLTAGFREGF
ncbi:hypothetical protein B0T25DRAFT_569621 [Lasiosphaeria hispida]|uniref:Beta-lactamase-related domain-containing protein n=1 Tax=Lasiosphaeria hispida TaxID=260671 RepID=A0AAJ0HE75_9PEZI|nr:hypothetical protein B0T25DRAFT_569621 [Lasiosphaeria hispida]